MVRGKTKDIKQFLKERKLTRSFNTWKSIKSKKKTIISVAFDNYDGSIRRSNVYVFKKDNKTIFKDFNTLKTLGSTKGTKKQALKKLFDVKKEPSNLALRGWNVEYKLKKSGIKLKNSNTVFSYNKTLSRLRSVTRTNSYRKRMEGRLTADLTYVSSGGKKVRVQVSSSSGFLNTKQKREKALKEAIMIGTKLAGFSPIDVIINDFWYEYWVDKQETLKKIR